MSSAPRLLGAVLVGGASARLGRPKDRELVGGEPMAERVARAVRGVVGDVVVVAGAGAEPHPALPTIHDGAPGRGPLGGLVAALEEASSRGLDGVLLVACDLPLVTPRLLGLIASASRHGSAAAPRRVRGSGVEATCAAYGVGVLPTARRRLGTPDRSLQALFRDVSGVVLDPPPEEPWGAALLNVNTESDLARARSALAGDGRGVVS